jgi:hypothetical protein
MNDGQPMKISQISVKRAVAAAAAACVAASALAFTPGAAATVQAAETGISTGDGPVHVVDTRVRDYVTFGRLADGEARQFVTNTVEGSAILS